jgi:hypothetical protein
MRHRVKFEDGFDARGLLLHAVHGASCTIAR